MSWEVDWEVVGARRRLRPETEPNQVLIGQRIRFRLRPPDESARAAANGYNWAHLPKLAVTASNGQLGFAYASRANPLAVEYHFRWEGTKQLRFSGTPVGRVTRSESPPTFRSLARPTREPMFPALSVDLQLQVVPGRGIAFASRGGRWSQTGRRRLDEERRRRAYVNQLNEQALQLAWLIDRPRPPTAAEIEAELNTLVTGEFGTAPLWRYRQLQAESLVRDELEFARSLTSSPVTSFIYGFARIAGRSHESARAFAQAPAFETSYAILTSMGVEDSAARAISLAIQVVFGMAAEVAIARYGRRATLRRAAAGGTGAVHRTARSFSEQQRSLMRQVSPPGRRDLIENIFSRYPKLNADTDTIREVGLLIRNTRRDRGTLLGSRAAAGELRTLERLHQSEAVTEIRFRRPVQQTGARTPDIQYRIEVDSQWYDLEVRTYTGARPGVRGRARGQALPPRGNPHATQEADLARSDFNRQRLARSFREKIDYGQVRNGVVVMNMAHSPARGDVLLTDTQRRNLQQYLINNGAGRVRELWLIRPGNRVELVAQVPGSNLHQRVFGAARRGDSLGNLPAFVGADQPAQQGSALRRGSAR